MLILNLTQKIKPKSIFTDLISSILTYTHHHVAQPSTISLSLNGFNLSFSSPCLESTDVARRVPHSSPMKDATSDAVARASVPRLSFFFFFLGFAPTRLDLCRFGFDSDQIEPYRSVTETGQNRPWIWLEQPKFSPQMHSNVFFAFFFLCFVNQG